MHDHQRRFLDLAFEYGALQLGEFTLKSGRVSPYFFNLGAIATGAGLARLAGCYADALEQAGIAYDGLFGPAYKGIPLASALAVELSRRGLDLPFAYDRKEAKDHGEGGKLVGRLGRRVIIVDDVITAGTAVRGALDLLRARDAAPAALLVALDRQERAGGRRSAIDELASQAGIGAIAVCRCTELVQYLRDAGGHANHIKAIDAYRARYGESD